MRSSLTSTRPRANAARGERGREGRPSSSTVAGLLRTPGAEQVHQELGAARAHETADAEHLAGAHREADVAQQRSPAAHTRDGEASDAQQRPARLDLPPRV